jgi:hypothetical protein
MKTLDQILEDIRISPPIYVKASLNSRVRQDLSSRFIGQPRHIHNRYMGVDRHMLIPD